MPRFLSADSLWWDGRLHPGALLRVDSDRTVTLMPGSESGGDEIEHLPGTLLPGLTDAHVHSSLVDLATVRAGGIAAVWDLGGVPDRLADLARRAGSALPRIRYAGPFLIAPGGYPSDRSWAAPGSWREIRSPAHGAEEVAAAHAAGASLIKMTAHAGGPMMPAETMTAIAGAAHEKGLPVVVHAEGPGTVANALGCGADLLAHTPWTEDLDDGLTRECAARTTWISTLDIHGWGRDTPELRTAVGNLRRFLAYGGKVRYGTDLGNGPLPPAINPREVRALLRTGLDPHAILTAMTDSDISWVPGGLDLTPDAFPDSLATARVLPLGVTP